MSDFYVDHGVYASAIGAPPTWGAPQEGDGSTKDAATASSIASIVLPGQPSAGNLLTICGLTLGATSGGTYNYTIGGSLTATVDNIVAAINGNASIGAATVGSTVAIGTPKVCNLMFARNTGGTTVEIMMRVGSTALNHASNANVAISASGWSPTITQFVGGTGGCWGHLINAAALGVSSSIAAGAYGLMVSKPMVWTATPNQLDWIWARTQSGKTITLPGGTSLIRGNVGFPLNLVFDSNTQWTGDSGTGVVRVTIKPNASNYAYFRPCNPGNGTDPVTYSAVMLGGLEIASDVSNSASTLHLFDGCIGIFAGRNIRFVEAAAPAANGKVYLTLNALSTIRLYNCELDFSTYSRASLQNGPQITCNGGFVGCFEWVGGSFKTKLTGTPPTAYGVVSPGYGGNSEIRLEDVAFSTDSAYSLKLFTATLSVATSTTYFATIKGCSGLVLDSGALGLQSQAGHAYSQRNAAVNFIGAGTGRPQRYECRNGIAEWNPAAVPAYPTLGATQFDGTVYSIRMYWLGTATLAQTNAQVHSYVSSRINRLADGVRTITQQLAIDTTKGIDKRHIALRVIYTDTSGISRSEWTHLTQDPQSSAATWADIGSWSNFAARKLILTTAQPVKQFTMIDAEVMLIGPAPGGTGNTDVFLDPEPAIT